MSYIIKLCKPKFSVIHQAFCSVHQLVQLTLAHPTPKSQLPTQVLILLSLYSDNDKLHG